MCKRTNRMTDEEVVMSLLTNKLKQEADDRGLFVRVGNGMLESQKQELIGIDRRELVRLLNVLRVKSFISFDRNHSLDEDRFDSMNVYLLPPILNYFEQKERARLAIRRERFQFWLPLCIAGLSALGTVANIIVTLVIALWQ